MPPAVAGPAASGATAEDASVGPLSPVSSCQMSFSDVGYGDDFGLREPDARESWPGDSASQLGALSGLSAYRASAADSCEHESGAGSEPDVEPGALSLAMLESIRSIERQIERLSLLMDRVCANTDARTRSERRYARAGVRPPQQDHDPPTRKKHHGRGRGNSRHNTHLTPARYAYNT